MRDFFKGWKRKTGCVMLALALTSSSVWIRSVHRGDELSFTLSNSLHSIGWESGLVSWWDCPNTPSSITYALEWKTWSDGQGMRWPGRQFAIRAWKVNLEMEQSRIELEALLQVMQETERGEPLTKFLSFDKSEEQVEKELDERFNAARACVSRSRVAIIDPMLIPRREFPIWPVTIALTLLSAYLLLSKQPSKRTTSEPPKDEP